MSALRWVLFLLSAECVVLLILIPRSTASAILAALFALFFTLYCWSIGCFARTTDTKESA